MNLKAFTNQELTARLEKLVKTERKITHLILWHILEIEERRIYAELGYDGMYAYLTKGLGYSDGSAYRRLQSARLLKQVPEVAEKIESGSLNLSQLTQVQKCIRESNKQGRVISRSVTSQILETLEHKNTFESEKVLALAFDLPVKTQEKIQTQKDESVRLEMTFNKEEYEELLMAKSLLSHICHEGSWSQVIAELARSYNKKKLVGRATQDKAASKSSKAKQEMNSAAFDLNNNLEARSQVKADVLSDEGKNPLRDKEVNSANKDPSIKAALSQRVVATRGLSKNKSKRLPIATSTKRILLKHAHHTCEYVHPTTKQRCSSKYQLQTEHNHPVALGGSNNLSNLKVLCRTHNLLMAKQLGLTNW